VNRAPVYRFLLAALLLLGCCPMQPGAPAPVAHRAPSLAAQLLDHGQVAIAAARWKESLDASQAVKLTGDDAADQQALLDARRAVDARWAPVAEALRSLRAALDAYRAAVDRGEPGNDAEVTAALCALRAGMPTEWLPLVPTVGCS
jgi:hypothetical protein